MIDDLLDIIAREECEKRLEIKYPKITEIFLSMEIAAPEILFDEVLKEVVEKEAEKIKRCHVP